MFWGDDTGDVFLGRDLVAHKGYSEHKGREIDEEVTRVLTEQYDLAKQLLVDSRETLDRIAEALLERETLEGSELALLVKGEPLPPFVSPVEALKDESKGVSKSRPLKDFPDGKIPDPDPTPA